MNGKFHRRFWVLFCTAATAFFAYKHLPHTEIGRTAFELVARGFNNPPIIVTGGDAHATPWNLRCFPISNKPKPGAAPTVVSLGDDREGFFQNSPLSPIDFAVILNNFQRLGAKKSACAAVLAWDAPDPIGLMALDKAIRSFDAFVMTAPLSRGALPDAMPPAFRKASISLDAVKNDCSLIPIVNRIPLPGVILGGKNTLAGFQVLDSEPTAKNPPMIARWEDRVVFAFPLLVVLQHLELTVDGVEIRNGEFIKLGPHGPIIPIDAYGRLTLPLESVKSLAQFPAATLIDAGNDLFPKNSAVLLRDDRSATETRTRDFSNRLVSTITAISSNIGVARDYPRLQQPHEIYSLAAVCLFLTALCGLPTFPRNIGLLLFFTACVAAQYIAFGSANIWLPGLPAMAAVLCAFVVSPMIPNKPRAVTVVEAPPINVPEPQLIEPPSPPAKKTPRKAAAKKTAPSRRKKSN